MHRRIVFNRRPSLGLSLVVLIGIILPASLRADSAGVWIAGDFHNHTRLTDGSYAPRTVFEKAFEEFGLTWMANSEHGGAYGRDPQGQYWESIDPPVTVQGDVRRDKNEHRLMWRWQSLLEYSFPIVAEGRKDPRFAGKVLPQGLEFNCPGHEHVSVAILADSAWPIAEFEYRFDYNDADTSGGPDGRWQGKNTTNDHAKALQAITWLKDNYPNNSYFIINHPERASRYRIGHLRDFNNLAPDIVFGIEGGPGHQKNRHRGGYAGRSFKYADNDMGGATYGGVGVFVARVGGLWDAMLGEGRRFFVYANSDFHDDGRDFFPGQYQKTYIKVSGLVNERSVLEGLRCGRSFFVAGDLVDAVEFAAGQRRRFAQMGEALQVRRGTDVQVSIQLRDPPGRNCLGDDVSLHSVDLIGGVVTKPVDKNLDDGNTPNPAYEVDVNPTTRVLARFDSGNWQTKADGWIHASFTLRAVDEDMYLRLRGTNLPPGTTRQTDKAGNPLSDELAVEAEIDPLTEARKDLWFYSNPIFIETR